MYIDLVEVAGNDCRCKAYHIGRMFASHSKEIDVVFHTKKRYIQNYKPVHSK
jgi:hypothetical protein